MNIIAGVLVILAGLFLFICGRKRSEFVICRLLVARSRILWGDKVHAFHQVAGIMVMIAGLLEAFGVFERLF